MRPSVKAAVPAVLLVGGLLGTTGCQRSSEDPAAEAGPASVPAPAQTPPEAADQPAAPPGVLLAYVWDCDGGTTLRMRNLLREDAITLEMHEGGRKLPRVVSASGAKYSDGSLTFWSKGDSATFEREGSAPIGCRQNRHESMLADARIRGVLFRGTGNEPGWTVEIGPGTRLEFVTNFGEDRHAFDAATESTEGGARVYSAADGERSIKVTVTAEPCTDDMSGWTFDHRMVVESGGQSLRGCATALR